MRGALLAVLFNSLDYVLFLPIVVAGFYLLPQRCRAAGLLAASYAFFAAWQVELILLLAASTLVDYGVGRRMAALPDRRGRGPYLLFSLAVNLGLLFTFKYAGFASVNLGLLCTAFELSIDVPRVSLPLPIGISFYTFQTLSYTIDVYRGRSSAERRLDRFALYVAFFPQLVAGPIERSGKLLPQLDALRGADWVAMRNGLWLITWGFFKKLVVADRLAVYVDAVYGAPEEASGRAVVLASCMFAYQDYCDFSGYTDIALGTAGLLGVRLSPNFNRPFAARDVQEFWQRWHMTLTRWVMDYVYTPLARGTRRGLPRAPAILITFCVLGVWHGAGWNFLLFGVYAGVAFLVGYLRRRWGLRLRDVLARPELARRPVVRALLPLHRGLQRVAVFGLFAGACILFRAESLEDIGTLLSRLARDGLTGRVLPAALPTRGRWAYELTLAGAAIGVIEFTQWLHDRRSFSRRARSTPLVFRWSLAYALIFAILMFAELGRRPFIYFQF